MFADDICYVVRAGIKLRQSLNAVERRGMKVSCSKIEYLCGNEGDGGGTAMASRCRGGED